MASVPISNPESKRGRPRGLRMAAVVLTVIAILAAFAGVVLKLGAAGPAPRSTSLPAAQLRTTTAGDAPGVIAGTTSSRALNTALAAASVAPTDPDLQAQLGFAFLQAARETGDPTDYGRAEAALRASLALDPNNVEGLIGTGSLALSRHWFAEALQIGQRALALNPSIATTYGVVADAEVELGQYAQAAVTVQRMVDLRPDLASYSRVSYQRELHGDLDGAIEAMQLAVSAAGPATENTEYVRVQLGNLYFATGRLDLARATYARSLAALPTYHFALAGLAKVEAAEGNYDQAIDLYRRATARLPLPEIVIALGETLQAAGRTREADDQYALVEVMQRLFAANGVRTDMELGAFFADHGSATQAVALAEAAFKERPSIFAADTLAWALYRAGRASDAAPFVSRALRLDTRNSRLLYHAGMIELALGQADVAQIHLREALALNPHFSSIDAPRAVAALQGLAR